MTSQQIYRELVDKLYIVNEMIRALEKLKAAQRSTRGVKAQMRTIRGTGGRRGRRRRVSGDF